MFKQPPFRIQEEGWGEFDMTIELTADKSYHIQHDLNFAQNRYESKHVIVSPPPDSKTKFEQNKSVCSDKLPADLQEPKASSFSCAA